MTSDGITRIMLTSWRAHGPDVPEDKNQNLYALPPVAPDEGGLHLDLTPFLLFDKAIIDTATLDRLDSERRPEFTRLRETIEVLGNLHLLQPENYSDILAQEREARAVQESIEHSLRDLGRVPREVLDSVAAWETIQRSFVPLFRKNWSAADSVSHGPRVLLTRDTHKVTKKQGKQLEKKLRQADRGEIQIDDDIRGIVQPYLAYVRSNLVLRNCFSGCPIYDWGDFDTFYRRAFLDIGVPEPIGLIERHLVDRVLDVELPDFRPEDPLQLDKVLRDPSRSGCSPLPRSSRRSTSSRSRGRSAIAPSTPTPTPTPSTPTRLLGLPSLRRHRRRLQVRQRPPRRRPARTAR
jgi:hypothetical protein